MNIKETLIFILLLLATLFITLFTVLYIAERKSTDNPITIYQNIDEELSINYIDYQKPDINIGKGIVLYYLIYQNRFEFYMENGEVLKLDDKDFFELSTRKLNEYEIREKHYGIKKAY